MSALVGKVAGAARDVGGGLVRQLQHVVTGGSADDDDAQTWSRWRSVTINRGHEDVMPNGQIPGPLAALGDLVEVQVRPAAGDKGTELAARLRQPEPTGAGRALAAASDHDPRQRVRAALREAKQLIEVGEVLRVDPTPHGHRPDTPTGRLVDQASRHARGEGVL